MNISQFLKPASYILFGVFTGLSHAAAIYPIDKAAILAGSKFDIKIEFNSVVNQDEIVLELNGAPLNKIISNKSDFIANEHDEDGGGDPQSGDGDGEFGCDLLWGCHIPLAPLMPLS